MTAGKSLRICYLIPENSPHSMRLLDHFAAIGYDVYVFSDRFHAFYPWPSKRDKTVPAPDHQVLDHASSWTQSAKKRAFSVAFPVGKALIKRLPFFVEDLGRRLHYFLKGRKLRTQVALLDPDIVHGLEISGNGIEAMLCGHRPFLLTVWGCDIRLAGERRGVLNSLLRRSLRTADAVTAPTNSLLDECFRNGVSPDVAHQIGMPGIDPAAFANASDGSSLSRLLGIPAGKKVILSGRALDSLYRIDVIVEAFSLVRERDPEVVLLLLDYHREEGFREEILELADRLGVARDVVLFRDMPVPYLRMPEVYALSSVMISIPQRDGMPQSMLEAFASGCPVVASDLDTYDGVLDHNQTGLRVTGSDPEELADAIQMCLSDTPKRQSIVENARRRVEERGNLFVEMGKLNDLYLLLTSTSDSSPGLGAEPVQGAELRSEW